MINSKSSILQSQKIDALKGDIPIYHIEGGILLLFFIENKKFEALLDIKVDCNEGVSLLEIIYPDDSDLFSIENPNGSAYDIFKFNFRIVKKSGEIIVVNAEFKRFENHNIEGTAIFHAELTNVIDLFEKDYETETIARNFCAMMEHTTDFIFFKDAHHVMTASSDTLAVIAGYKKGRDLVGKIDYESFPREHADAYYKLEKEIYQGKLSESREIQPFVDENGVEGWVDNRKYAIKNTLGEITGLFGVARIVTENVQNQAKLKKQTQELEKAQQIAHLGNWTYDAIDNKLVWSNEVYNIFEIDKETKEISDELFINSIHPEDREMVNRAYSVSIENKTAYDIVHRLLFGTDRIKFVHEIGEHRFDRNGDFIGSFGTVQEITKIKEYENEIKKQGKLIISQSRFAAMGEMISMIAHQWRQPLHIIGATIGGLRIKIAMDNFNTDMFEDKLKNIESHVQYMSKTIDDFRNFFKLDKEAEEFHISDAIETSLNLLGFISGSIRIIKNYGNCKPITTYKNELIQVLLNIFKNAQDNFIECKTKESEIEITIYQKKSHYYIKVKDNGGGIPKDIIEKIFDPYFSTKDEKNGTGLGLYMSKIIIEEHCKGSLSVKNVKGGAEFEIEIISTI